MEESNGITAAERSIGITGDVVGYVHTGDVILQGIRALLPDFASRVENFLAAYLGSERYPVPFGGRDRELRELTAWLDDSAAPPYLLVTAPAGRGKSALVTHWLQRLAGAPRPDLDIVFFPISIRVHTNLAGVVFPSLAVSLARLHGAEDTLRSTLGTSPEHWRALMSGYLRSLPPGRRLLLILDGLDEAAGWELGHDLFPLGPPPGLRVVVSARLTASAPAAANWIARLGWSRPGLARAMSLGRLSAAGMEQALRSMGAPLDTVAERDDLVRELHRLSCGDPFLVALYVDELWGRGASASTLEIRDLAGIRPGLEGYFRQWWEDQRVLWGDQAPLLERRVSTVLGLLAAALGPLRTDDLLELVPETGLDSWTLVEALRPLARFVLGDGREQGFVLAHPLLADYFFNRLPAREQRQWEERFLAWGGSVLDRLNRGELASGEAPAYVVQYFGAHLDRAGAGHGRLAGLVSEGWWRAWEAVEGGFAGFLGDVDRAWAALRQHNEARVQGGEPPERLGFEFLCALCHASAASLSQNLSPELVAALVAHRWWTVPQALAYVRRMHQPVRRAHVIEILVPHVPEGQRGAVVAEAVATARQFGDEEQCARFLSAVAPWAGAVHRGDVLAMAKRLRREEHRVRVALALAPTLTEGEAVELAGWAEQVRGYWERLRLAEALAPRLPDGVRDALLSPFLTTARQVVSDEMQLRILEPLAPHLRGSHRDEAFGLALRMRTPFRRSALVGLLAPGLTPVQLAAVVQAAEGMENSSARVQLLAAVLPYLPEPLRARTLSGCFTALGRIGGADARARAAAALLPHASPAQRTPLIDLLLPLIRGLRNDEVRAGAIRGVAPYIQFEQGTLLLEYAGGIGNLKLRADCLVALASSLPVSARGEVLREAGLIRHEGTRLRALARVAALLGDEEIDAVIDSVGRLDDDRLRLATLGSVVSGAGDALRRRLLARARAELANDGDSELLEVLVTCLDEPERSSVLGELLDRVRHIGDAPERAMLLAGLFPRLGKEERVAALAEVNRLDDASARAHALELVVPHLAPGEVAETLEFAVQLSPEALRARLLEALAASSGGRHAVRVLAAAHAVDDDRLKAHLLVSLAGLLPAADRVRVVAAAEGIRDEQVRAKTLERVAPLLPEAERLGVAAAARRIINPRLRMGVLQALAPQLPAKHREPVLAESVIEDERLRNRVVDALSPALSNAQRRTAVRQAWAAAGEEGISASDRAATLAALAPHLASLRHPDALSEAASLGDDLLIVGVVEALLPHLRGRSLLRALDLARGMHNPALRMRLMKAVVPALPRPARSRAFPAIAELLDEERVVLVEGIAPHLSQEDAMDVLASAASLRDERVKARLLWTVVPRLPPDGRRQVAEAAARMKLEAARAELLEALALHLSPPEKAGIFWQAVQLETEELRVRVLGALVPHLDDAERVRLLSEAARVRGDTSRARLLEVLIPVLGESDLPRVLSLAGGIGNDDACAGVLAALVPRMPSQHAQRVIKLVQRIRGEWHRMQPLTAVISRFGSEFTTEILDMVRRIGDPWFRVRALSSLVQHVDEPRRTQVLDQAIAQARKVRHENVAIRLLGFLMPLLSAEQRTEVLLLANRSNESREHALQALVPAWAGEIGPAGRYALWKELLARRRENGRMGLWEEFVLFTALLDGSGPQEFDGLGRAIRSIGNWWP